jgi:hypothetical protein
VEGVHGVTDIGLAEVIRQLRGDLALAEWEGGHKDLKFELGPIELEFAVVVDSSRQAGARARLWVVDLSANGKKGLSVTHRIKLTLQPGNPDEPEGRPWVAGRSADGEETPNGRQ